MNTATYDWRDVVNKGPKGFVVIDHGEEILHGPIDKIVVNEHDDVEIYLQWTARMRVTTKDDVEPKEKWFMLYDKSNLVLRFKNHTVNFLIQDVTGKPRLIKFGRTVGVNTIYLNAWEGMIASFAEEKGHVLHA